MRDYGKLSPFFWTRGSGKRLRGNPDAQVVAAYLSTAPSANMIGIYYVSLASIASDTGITEDRVRAALAAIEAAGYAAYDFEAEIVWVPNHAQFEIGAELRAGDKRRPRIYAELRQVNDHRFADDFRRRYAPAYGLAPPSEGASKGHPAANPNADAPSKGHAGFAPSTGSGHKQDQDQDQGAGAGRSLGPDGDSGSAFGAWREGIKAVTGKPVSQLAPNERRDVVDLANGHAGGRQGEDLMTWIRETAEVWARQHDPRFGGFKPVHCKTWLDAGRPARSPPGKRGAEITKQPYDPDAPWMKLPEVG